MALGDTNYYRVQFISRMQGQAFVTTIAVKADPTAPAGAERTAEQVAHDVDDWLGALYAAMVTVDGELETIKVTSIVGDLDTDTPTAFELGVARAGARDNSGDQLPDAVVAWNRVRTAAAIRSGHGGWFSLPAVRRLNLASTGLFDTGTVFWTSQTAFNNALLAGHDWGPLGADGHESFVLYSHTRHKRHEPNYLFDVTSISRAARVHWLRSRDA